MEAIQCEHSNVAKVKVVYLRDLKLSVKIVVVPSVFGRPIISITTIFGIVECCDQPMCMNSGVETQNKTHGYGSKINCHPNPSAKDKQTKICSPFDLSQAHIQGRCKSMAAIVNIVKGG